MAGYKPYNKAFWKKLDKFCSFDQEIIIGLMNEIGGEAFGEIQELTPVKYGGLLKSAYYEPHSTEHGYSIVLGYKNTSHINYDPAGTTVDDFTNPELLKGLANTRRNHRNVRKIQRIIHDAPIEFKAYMKQYIKNRGGSI